MPGTFLPAKDGRHRVPTTYDQQYPYPDGKPWLSPFPYPKVIGHSTSHCHHHDLRGKTWLSALTDVRFWPVGLLPERGSSPSAPPVGFWRHVAPGPAPKHPPVPVLTPTESRPPLPSPMGNGSSGSKPKRRGSIPPPPPTTAPGASTPAPSSTHVRPSLPTGACSPIWPSPSPPTPTTRCGPSSCVPMSSSMTAPLATQPPWPTTSTPTRHQL